MDSCSKASHDDVMLASYVHDASSAAHAVESLALERLNYKAMDSEVLRGKGVKALAMSQVAVEAMTTWACERADLAMQLTTDLRTTLADEGLDRYLRRVRTRVAAGAVRHRAGRHPRRHRRPRRALGTDGCRTRDTVRPHLRARRHDLQHQLAQATRRSAVREDAAAGPQAHRQGPHGIDSRGSVGGTRGLARDRTGDPRLARVDEAEGHLRRCPAAARASDDRPRPHDVQPGGRRDRAPEQQRPEPAEHSDPHRARTRDPRSASSPSRAMC